MMEVVMAMAKTMSMPQVLNEMERSLKEYKHDLNNEQKKHQLHLFSLIYCLRTGTEGTSITDSIKLVQESERAAKFFDTKTN